MRKRITNEHAPGATASRDAHATIPGRSKRLAASRTRIFPPPPAKTVKAAVIVDSIRLVELNKRAILNGGLCYGNVTADR